MFNHLNQSGVFSFEIETPPESSHNRNRPGTYHPDAHVRPSVIILERYVDGRLDDTELHETTMRFWDVATVNAYLGDDGFIDVIASNVFTDGQSPEDNRWLVVGARRR